jgi:hypothetical protein
MNKTEKIKQAVAKIDLTKINAYLEEHPKSHTLKRIIRYKERVLNSKNDEEVFKLTTDLAYNLDTICDGKKTGYVKDEAEKKH